MEVILDDCEDNMERCKMLTHFICFHCTRPSLNRYGGNLCRNDQMCQDYFERLFAEQYSMAVKVEGNQPRNVAEFFTYLLYTDSISWHVLACISLTREESSQKSIGFVGSLFRGLRRHFGLRALVERFQDPGIKASVASIFRKDLPDPNNYAKGLFKAMGLERLFECMVLETTYSPRDV